MELNGYKVRKTEAIIENHIHGAFGIDFNNATVEEILECSKLLLTKGVGGFFPTFVTDTVENIKKQIEVIKEAKSKQIDDMAEILGIHLEGNFINPKKCGIQDSSLFMIPSIENYKLIEDDLIKIVTVAPELDEDLIDYLKSKGVKVQAGHCVGEDLKGANGVTHLFNAMSGISHREKSTSLSALIDDEVYAEVIMDLVHLNKDIVELVLKSKPADKILPVSDCLPVSYSKKSEMMFCGKTVYYDGVKITSKEGTLAGSALLLDDILKKLFDNGIDAFGYLKNLYEYHGLNIDCYTYWNEDNEVVAVEKKGLIVYRKK